MVSTTWTSGQSCSPDIALMLPNHQLGGGQFEGHPYTRMNLDWSILAQEELLNSRYCVLVTKSLKNFALVSQSGAEVAPHQMSSLPTVLGSRFKTTC